MRNSYEQSFSDKVKADKIVICGDIAPIGRPGVFLCNGEHSPVFGDVGELIRFADLAIFNLECPLCKTDSPIAKTGVALRASPATAKGLKNAGFHIAGLANNHIRDQGSKGVLETLANLKSAGLQVVGAGKNSEDAGLPYLCEVNGVRIAVFAVAEAEFSIVSKCKPGANPIDLISFVRQIRRLRKEVDLILVLLHGGNEFYPLPRPGLMSLCRFMVEEGANAVICQHSHCIGAYEDYCGSLILYGQGNCVFDYECGSEEWNEGLVVELCFASDRLDWTFHPIVQNSYSDRDSREHSWLTLLKGERKQSILDRMRNHSLILNSPEAVEAQWHDYCVRRGAWYLSTMAGLNPILRFFNRGGHFTDYLVSEKRLRLLGNLIRCESHRELILTLPQFQASLSTKEDLGTD